MSISFDLVKYFEQFICFLDIICSWATFWNDEVLQKNQILTMLVMVGSINSSSSNSSSISNSNNNISRWSQCLSRGLRLWTHCLQTWRSRGWGFHHARTMLGVRMDLGCKGCPGAEADLATRPSLHNWSCTSLWECKIWDFPFNLLKFVLFYFFPYPPPSLSKGWTDRIILSSFALCICTASLFDYAITRHMFVSAFLAAVSWFDFYGPTWV